MRHATAALALAATLGTPGTAEARPACDDLRGREVESTSAVRVLAQRDPQRYVACLRDTGRVISLGPRVGKVAIAGTFVAYDPLRTAGGLGFRSTGVVRRNLRTGARRRVRETEHLAPAARILVNRRGEVAWIHPGQDRVWKLDRNGSDPILTEGRAGPRSLRLAGSRLAWRADGARGVMRLGRQERCGGPSSAGVGLTAEARLFARYVVCHRRSGRRTSIAPAATWAASGRFVAYNQTIPPPPRGGYIGVARLRVLDSASGEVVRTWDRDGTAVFQVVVTQRGSIAWSAFLDGEGFRVMKSDATGEAVVLDADPESAAVLSLRGNTLRWQGQTGERREATLVDHQG